MKRRQLRCIFGLAALLCLRSDARAQDAVVPDQPAAPAVRVVLSDVTRVESWSFFAPRTGGGDPTYNLLGNRATLAVSMRSRHLDLYGAFQYAQMIGLPSRSTGPGPLGPGPIYFDAARATGAYQLYIRAMALRVKSDRGLSLDAGRMDIASAMESSSRSAAITRIKSDRLAGRLLGGAGWTPFQRAFDGVHLALTRPRWQASSSLLFPSQGAFEESANPTMSAVRVAAGQITLGALDAPRCQAAQVTGCDSGDDHRRVSELQVFAAHYRDRRAVRARPDNSGLGASSVDVAVATVGASHVSAIPLPAGKIDSVLWAAAQFGDWYGSDHRAFSAIAEGGYELPLPWTPQVRAGLLIASGDRDPRDLRHGTFFPMLPTTGPELLAGTFAQMNLRQVFGELTITPCARLSLSASLHRLSLADANDRWYSGTGATASRGTYFGFSTRSSFFATGLGTLAIASADGRFSDRWRVRVGAGIMHGGDVVRPQFAGTRLAVFSLENHLTF